MLLTPRMQQLEQLPAYSVTIPTFNGKENLLLLYEQIASALDQLEKGSEIIFIDDGNTDGTFDLLQDLHEKDGRVKVVRLARNSGQHAAIAAGIKCSRGEVVIIADDDLEIPFNNVAGLLKGIEEGYDIAFGRRVNRKCPFFGRKIPSYLFNLLISLLLFRRVHDIGCSFSAFRRTAIEDLKKFGSIPDFISEFRQYKTCEKEFECRESAGKTRYSPLKLIELSFHLTFNCIINRVFLFFEREGREHRSAGYVIEKVIM